MDKIDAAALIGYSAFCYGVLGIDGWYLLDLQTVVLAGYFIGRKLIDRWIDRKYA